MKDSELAQLELFAEMDELIRRLTQWVEHESAWEPMNHCRALVQRMLGRLETLRIRLESPLVVATFGGTGTGKSSLVNALVGADVTQAGRQRPTTRQPVLLIHPRTDLQSLSVPHEDFHVVTCDSDLLRDIVIIDCPDPDTSESEAPGSNLARLHGLLPHCDVLIYTSTQQKYRSARVGDELGQIATGCRLLFVQTHADIDEDIREDWSRQLDGEFEVPELFFVDSTRALAEQKHGHAPTGDFARLQQVIMTQLASSQRARIRRANLLDLIDAALRHCNAHFERHWPGVEQLEGILEEQRAQLVVRLSGQLEEELLSSSNLWERRLLTAVTGIWGFSPFSSVLRFYNGLGGWIASSTLMRARTSAQVALIGSIQGARWLTARKREREAESQLDRIAAFGLDDASLREAQLVTAGYAAEARLDPALAEAHSLDRLRHEAVRVEDEFLGSASRQIDDIIERLAKRNSGPVTRGCYEVLFLIYLLFVLFRIGRNFFVDSFLYDAPLLTMDFYASAGVFFVLWSGLLVMCFTQGLRRGLQREINELARQLAGSRFSDGLFPQLEDACRALRLQRDRLRSLTQTTSELRSRAAVSPALGAPLKLRQPQAVPPLR